MDIPRNKSILLLITITVVGALVRVLGVLNWHGLLFDEIASVSIALEPISRIWETLRIEMNPPLHYLFLKAWMYVFGTSDTAIRMSSVAIGTLNILTMYILGARATRSRLGGIYSALITSLASTPLFLSVLARMYGMLFLFSALSAYFLLRISDSKTSAPNTCGKFAIYVGYTASLTLAMYTHLTALALPIAYFIYILYIKWKNKTSILRPFIVTTGIATLLYMPWFVNFVVTRLTSLGGNVWYIYAQARDLFFLTIPNRFLIEGSSSGFLGVSVFTFFAIVIFSGLFKLSREDNAWSITCRIRPPQVLALLILYLPMSMLFALQLNSLRYYTVSMVGLIILIAHGLKSLSSSAFIPRKTLIALVLALLVTPSFGVTSMPKVAWPDVAKFIENNERPGDIVIAGFSNDLLATRYYYSGDSELVAFAPKNTPQMSDFNSELEFVIRTNANVYVSESNIEEFGDLIGDRNRVFFVYDGKLFGDAHEYYLDWFARNNWRRANALESATFTQINVLLMEKSN